MVIEIVLESGTEGEQKMRLRQDRPVELAKEGDLRSTTNHKASISKSDFNDKYDVEYIHI